MRLRRDALEAHAREPVKPDQLDQHHDLRLRSAQPDRPAPDSEATRQDRQVDHQRGIGERQLGEIDHDVGLGADRAGQRAAAETLRGPVLVAAATESRSVFVESDYL